mgnify:CR=1 FL=1
MLVISSRVHYIADVFAAIFFCLWIYRFVAQYLNKFDKFFSYGYTASIYLLECFDSWLIFVLSLKRRKKNQFIDTIYFWFYIFLIFLPHWFFINYLRINLNKSSSLFSQGVSDILNKWFHIRWDISLLDGLCTELYIEKFFHQYHSFKSVKVNPTLTSNWFISFNNPLLEFFSVSLWNRCSTDRHSCFFKHVRCKYSLWKVPKIKSSLNLISIKNIKCFLISFIKEVAAI